MLPFYLFIRGIQTQMNIRYHYMFIRLLELKSLTISGIVGNVEQLELISTYLVTLERKGVVTGRN